MTWTQLANLSASGLVVLAAAVFALTYHLRAPWRSTPIGRHIMGVTIAIGLLGLYTVLATIWRTGATAEALRAGRTAVMFLIAVLIAQRTRLLVTAQRGERPAD